MNRMKNTGDTCVGMVMARLLEYGEKVLLPFGENHRYDLVVDRHGKFLRIQCKSGRQRGGVVKFNCCSTNRIRGKWVANGYRDQADLFAVYCPDNKRLYVVPVNDVGESMGVLRLDPVRNGQGKNIRWAKDYDMSLSPNG